MIIFPYYQFDLIDLQWIIIGELIIFILAMLTAKQYRKKVLMLATLLILFPICGEIAFRLYYFGFKSLSPEYRPAEYGHPHSNFKYNPDTYTGLKPNTVVLFRGCLFRVNSEGFRGKDYSKVKPANTFRIILAGASVGMGSCVNEKERFSALLEQKLNNANLGPNIEFINLSIGGSKYGHIANLLRKVAIHYDPDMIMIVGNETITKRKKLILAPRKAKAPTRPYIKLVLDHNLCFFSQRFFFGNLMRQTRDGKLETLQTNNKTFISPYSTGTLVTQAWNTITKHPPSELLINKTGTASTHKIKELAPKQIEAMAQEKALTLEAMHYFRAFTGDAEVVMYLLKPKSEYNPERAYRFKSFLEYYGKQKGIHIIDTYGIDFSNYPASKLTAYPGESHPSALAHKLYADAMYPALLRIVKKRINDAR